MLVAIYAGASNRATKKTSSPAHHHRHWSNTFKMIVICSAEPFKHCSRVKSRTSYDLFNPIALHRIPVRDFSSSCTLLSITFAWYMNSLNGKSCNLFHLCGVLCIHNFISKSFFISIKCLHFQQNESQLQAITWNVHKSEQRLIRFPMLNRISVWFDTLHQHKENVILAKVIGLWGDSLPAVTNAHLLLFDGFLEEFWRCKKSRLSNRIYGGRNGKSSLNGSKSAAKLIMMMRWFYQNIINLFDLFLFFFFSFCLLNICRWMNMALVMIIMSI